MNRERLRRAQPPAPLQALILTAACLLSGCLVSHRDLDSSYAGPAPMPEAAARAFAYEPAPLDVRVRRAPRAQGHRYRLHECLFRFQEPLLGRDVPLRAELYLTTRRGADGRAPLVVVLPILGGDYQVSRSVARGLAAAGLHAFIPLRETDAADIERTLEAMDQTLVESTVRLRRVVDWLAARPEVDPGALGLMGVSLGGIRACILAAVEPRFRACVLVMAGGDLAEVYSRSDERAVRRWWRDEKARTGLDDDALRALCRERTTADPLKLAPHVDARKLLMFITTLDSTVPTSTQEALRKALGGPETWYVTSGHYSAAVYLFWIRGRAVQWLKGKLPIHR